MCSTASLIHETCSGLVQWTITPQEDAQEATGSMGSMAEGAKGRGCQMWSQPRRRCFCMFLCADRKKMVVGIKNSSKLFFLFKWFKHTWDADKDFVQVSHQEYVSLGNISLVMRCWQRHRDNSSFQAWQVDFRWREHHQLLRLFSTGKSSISPIAGRWSSLKGYVSGVQ